MKRFIPLVLLAALFAGGCATQEDYFMSGTELPAAKPAAPVTPALTLPSDPAPATTKSADIAPAAPVVVKKTKTKKITAPKTVAVTIAPAQPAPPLIVTPDNSLAGRVLVYNSPGHFVVLDFPAGPMPKADDTMFLYRAGLKVAEIKITGPQRDNDTVADVISGDAQAGDEVRDQ